MSDLPAVQDDLKKARQTALMLGICPENTIELVNATNAELEKQYKLIQNRILLLSRVLSNETGILGIQDMKQGFLWDKMKKSALDLEESFDSIDIKFEKEDEEMLCKFIKKQEAADTEGKKLSSLDNSTKICGVLWKHMKEYAMAGKRDGKQIKVPLNED